MGTIYLQCCKYCQSQSDFTSRFPSVDDDASDFGPS